ncbi:MAG: hypothetical protein CMN72_05215 [Sphingomonas sp.]|nr:hypothetical protein [Sphingomonas sp.]
MTMLMTKAAMGLALGATAMTAAVPAEAQRYRDDYRYHDQHRDNGTGTAIVAGIAGLAIGAAIASASNNRREYRDYRYDRPDYRDRYYRGGYYARPAYRPRQYCSVRRVWDPYLHRRVAVRYCR